MNISVPAPYPTFSQCGEDRIIQFLFNHFKQQSKLFYVDVGSAFPAYDNNTFLFYCAGGRGITVEADPEYVTSYADQRPNDRNLSVAVVPKRLANQGTITFSKMADKGHSTASVEMVRRRNELALENITVPCITINDLLMQNTSKNNIDLLSIDIEGFDLEVLTELDFAQFNPKVVIAENDAGVAVHLDLMLAKDYHLYASTHVNSIYVRNKYFF